MNMLQTIQKYNMISHKDHVLVAVSGGADSVALLHGLLELRETLSLELSVCHINHNLRGGESQADAGFVRKLCADLSLQFFLYTADIKQEGTSLEEAARLVRYSYLHRCAAECKASKIALGHNQNDNAETLLLRLGRGTGLTGLCGIPPVRDIFIRPLIETGRGEIEIYLAQHGISYRTDSSNFDKTFSRNRIRHDIIPVLKKINPQTVAQLSKSIELFREDEEYLNQLANEALPNCLADGNIHIPAILKLPKALQKRVIRAALTLKSSLKNISQQHIIQIESLLFSENGKETHLPGGLRVRREYEMLLFLPASTAIPEMFSYDITMDVPVFIPALGNYVLISLKSFCNNYKKNSVGMCTKYFNYDKINGTIKIRNRQPSDRIAIAGVGNKKLKKELCDRKVPRIRRDLLPLLAVGSDVLWIMDIEYGRTSCAYAPEPGKMMLAVEVLR